MQGLIIPKLIYFILKGGVSMDWLDRMNGAMDYIEAHLMEDISYDQVAKRACCSTYHFQRMFSFIADVPLSEYIRRRRLTLAAFELQMSTVKVIDIAFKYGYESPEAFSRAFKYLHGVMPTSARDKGVALKAYPRMSFHISIKGDVEMNYRIEEKQAFEMFGISTEIML
jgi:AraC family transcriptional regulator